MTEPPTRDFATLIELAASVPAGLSGSSSNDSSRCGLYSIGEGVVNRRASVPVCCTLSRRGEGSTALAPVSRSSGPAAMSRTLKNRSLAEATLAHPAAAALSSATSSITPQRVRDRFAQSGSQDRDAVSSRAGSRVAGSYQRGRASMGESSCP
jgi:hypothetical protein